MNELHYQLDLLKAMNQNLMEKERMYRTVCESAVGAFLYYSFGKNRVTTLGQWKEFFPFEIREGKELSRLLDVVDEKYALALRDVLFLEKTGQETATTECMLKDSKIWMQCRGKVYYDEKGQPTDKVIYINNITKFRIQNEELTYMAYYDSLTGLYNRNYFVRLLGDYIRKASETNSVVSVMLLDMDDFHKINDGQGMVVGDELVQTVGSFLRELCGKKEVIGCHLHTDVYLIAVYNPAGSRTVESIYEEIQKRTKYPFRLSDGQGFQITFCAGVAEYPEAAASAIDLINCAEIMVFKAKAQGKNKIQYFNTSILQEFLQTAEVEGKLKDAIFNQNFEMYYQPQYSAGSRKLRGMEALIRWRDGDNKMISPSVFIPIAEKNGTIIPIGKWVVEQSISQYAKWKKQFGHPFVMSINISALQYSREDFADQLLQLIEKYQVQPSEIELEITESIFIEDFQAVYEKLKFLRSYGVRVSLDDFGTGFSSLSYLKRLPIDTLKIDKSFIDTVLSDSATRVITEAIVHLAKDLGFETIAEGVEEERQLQYLHGVGCDTIQGYLLGKPAPKEEIEKLLASES